MMERDKPSRRERGQARRHAPNGSPPRRGTEGSRCRSVNVVRNELDGLLEQQLQQPIESPDLTRSIMGRLGYMRVPHHVARRHRIRRWLGRSLVCLVALTVIGTGIQLSNTSPDARGPSEITLPSAITSDLQHHQHRMHDAFRLLQEMTPAVEWADWDMPMRHDGGGVNGAQPRGHVLPGELENGSDSESVTPLFDEDVNRSAIAPVQWA